MIKRKKKKTKRLYYKFSFDTSVETGKSVMERIKEEKITFKEWINRAIQRELRRKPKVKNEAKTTYIKS